MRSAGFESGQRIDMRLRTRVTGIDPTQKSLTRDDGSQLDYGALLRATGASPARLAIPGADQPHVHVLRTLADADALIARLDTARSCVIVGASFIGLEAAAALSTRGIEVHVRSDEHTSELPSLMRRSYAVFCLTKRNAQNPCQSTY